MHSEDVELSPNAPLSWLDSAHTALYIKQAEKEYRKVFANSSFYQDWAEASFSLRAWEGLDSVLRIMPTPEPERLAYFLAQFFSYFVSPSMEVNSLPLEGEKVLLKTSVSEKSLPEIAKYLSACIAYIPCFNKNSNVSCTWEGDLLQIHFFNQQATIFETSVAKTHITPELMNSLLEDFKKKEELLIIREKALLKKEKSLEEQEKTLLLKQQKRERQLKNSLLNAFGQLFNLSKKSKINSKNKKPIKGENNMDQFSFDLD